MAIQYDNRRPYLSIICLDHDPVEAVKLLSDIHLGNSITHSAQLLCLAKRVVFADAQVAADGVRRGYQLRVNSPELDHLYKPAFRQGVWFLWIMRSQQNYRWVLEFRRAAIAEYQYRFGRSVIPRREVSYSVENIPLLPDIPPLQDLMLREFPQASIAWNIVQRDTFVDRGVVDLMHNAGDGLVRGFDLNYPQNTHRLVYCEYRYKKAKWTGRDIPIWFRDYQINRRVGSYVVNEPSPRNSARGVSYVEVPDA